MATLTPEERAKIFAFAAPVQRAEALTNTRVKLYPEITPDGNVKWFIGQIITFDRMKFNPHGMEKHTSPQKCDPVDIPEFVTPTDEIASESPEMRFWERSYKRARQECFDLVICNPVLDTFCTFTVDSAVCDRSNYGEIVARLNTWLSNRVQRCGMKYILVPEYHKDGENIHFHGLINFDALKLVDSGHKRKGQTVYNVSDLPLGFSTAVHISGEKCTEIVSKYIWKYMTKQNTHGKQQKIGGRFFLHGGDLMLPRFIYSNESFTDAPGVMFQPYDGCACKMQTLTAERQYIDLEK